MGRIRAKGQIFNEVWPQFEESALIMDTVEIVVQFNGKFAFGWIFLPMKQKNI